MSNLINRVKKNNELCLLCIVIFIFVCLLTFTYTLPNQSAIAAINKETIPADNNTLPIKESTNTEQNSVSYLTLDNLPTDNININKPIYDTQTLEEKKNNNLPLQLPDLPKYYGEKTVYLTFDDGPDATNTPEVLAILKNANVPATFFVLGILAEQRPELIKQIFEDGHALGLHSYNHKYNELYKSPNDYLAQLTRTENVIDSILGIRPVISRAPGGAGTFFNNNYWQALKTNGYLNFDWNISSGDASKANANDIINNILSQIDNPHMRSHAIVLMHDGASHQETVQALPTVIKMFRDRGFEFRVINLTTPSEW